jgi:hypothetical protein
MRPEQHVQLASKQPTTYPYPYPEPHESSTHPHTQFLRDYLNITLYL